MAYTDDLLSPRKDKNIENRWKWVSKDPLKHEHFPAGVDEGASEEQAVHGLVHQPVEHHLPVPRADGDAQLEVPALAQVVVADGEQVDHLHVEGHSGAHGDGWQLIGHLFTVHKHGAWEKHGMVRVLT